MNGVLSLICKGMKDAESVDINHINKSMQSLSVLQLSNLGRKLGVKAVGSKDKMIKTILAETLNESREVASTTK